MLCVILVRHSVVTVDGFHHISGWDATEHHRKC